MCPARGGARRQSRPVPGKGEGKDPPPLRGSQRPVPADCTLCSAVRQLSAACGDGARAPAGQLAAIAGGRATGKSGWHGHGGWNGQGAGWGADLSPAIGPALLPLQEIPHRDSAHRHHGRNDPGGCGPARWPTLWTIRGEEVQKMFTSFTAVALFESERIKYTNNVNRESSEPSRHCARAVTKLPAAINDTGNSLTAATEHPLIVSRGDIVDHNKGKTDDHAKDNQAKDKRKRGITGKPQSPHRRLAGPPAPARTFRRSVRRNPP